MQCNMKAPEYMVTLTKELLLDNESGTQLMALTIVPSSNSYCIHNSNNHSACQS